MYSKLIASLLLVASLVACVPSHPPIPAVDAYMALAPARMYAGEKQAVSLSLWAGEQPAAGWVEVSLHKGGRQVLREREFVSGKEAIPLQVPSQPG